MISISLPTDTAIEEAAKHLHDGQLVAFPTETVYGLGANALDQQAVQRIFSAKGRPSNNPLIVHVASLSAVLELIDPAAYKEIRDVVTTLSAFWPGPLTTVVPKHPSIPDITTAGQPSVGLRIPNHPVALSLLRKVSLPIAAPSANLSNYISPTTAEHVATHFKDSVSMVLDGGSSVVGLESTVLSLLDPHYPTILRPGAITREQIAEVLQIPLERVLIKDSHESGATLVSPGLLDSHYSPKTKLSFLKDVDVWSIPPQKIGLIAFSEGLNLDFDFHAISVLSANGNLNEVASGLFAALREMDNLNLDLILIDSCIESGIGHAIMNRLKRAVSKR